MPTAADLRSGVTVRAINGQTLGVVQGVRQEHFSVVLEDRELWLPVSSVFTVEHDVVTLIYERDGVFRNGCATV